MIDIISMAVCSILFLGIAISAWLARRNVDYEKTGALTKSSILLFGLLIPSEILNARGKKWANRRNICVALLFLTVITTGAVDSLRK